LAKKGKKMLRTSPASSGVSVPQPPTEIVGYSAVSIFKSRSFKLTAATITLEAVVVWILPKAASLVHKTLNPLLVKSLFGAVLIGALFLCLKMRKQMLYEISLLYTIYGGNPWWTVINDNIVLGAIPLEHQLETLKKLGITHVITLLEPFELIPGIISPIQSDQWKAEGIEHTHIQAPDFEGVISNQIDQAVTLLDSTIQKNPKAKFYIHCKAGRGRSTTIVLCDLVTRDNSNFPTKETTYAHLKKLRPQVNLNRHQMAAAQTYLDEKRHPLNDVKSAASSDLEKINPLPVFKTFDFGNPEQLKEEVSACIRVFGLITQKYAYLLHSKNPAAISKAKVEAESNLHSDITMLGYNPFFKCTKLKACENDLPDLIGSIAMGELLFTYGTACAIMEVLDLNHMMPKN
jgi:predicted protein tyrosine phosphatase